jgi:hypothetical protein
MGTLHYASLQFFVPSRTITFRDGSHPITTIATWQHVALFELQKDYTLSFALAELAPSTDVADEYTRRELGEEVEDRYHFQVFKRDELPSPETVYADDDPPGTGRGGLYAALLAAAAALSGDVRVVFWRDQ